jgi:hypothetical protein
VQAYLFCTAEDKELINMKITAKHLRRLIREEFTRVVLENSSWTSSWHKNINDPNWSFDPVGDEGPSWPGTPVEGIGLPRYRPNGEERQIYSYVSSMAGSNKTGDLRDVRYAVYGDYSGPEEDLPPLDAGGVGGPWTLPGGPDPDDQAALRTDRARRRGLEANPRPQRLPGGKTTVTGGEPGEKYVLLMTKPLPHEWTEPWWSDEVPADQLANEIDTIDGAAGDSGEDKHFLRNKTDLMVIRVSDGKVVAATDAPTSPRRADKGIGTFVWDTFGATPAEIRLSAGTTTAKEAWPSPYPEITRTAE